MAHRLTEDLLHLIFQHALPTVVKEKIPTPSDVRSLPPLNFSQVCRLWRSVVLSYPSLWSYLDINYNGLGTHPSVCILLEKWLHRGADAPLNCFLYLFQVYNGSQPIPPLALILKEWHRWNQIHIRVHPNAWSAISSAIDPVTFRCSTSLKSLTLSNDILFASSIEPRAFLDLAFCNTGVASQLQVLEVCSNVKWVVPDRLHLPNLRELKLSTELGCDFDVILASCCNIAKLTLFVQNAPQPSRSRTKAIILPKCFDDKSV